MTEDELHEQVARLKEYLAGVPNEAERQRIGFVLERAEQPKAQRPPLWSLPKQQRDAIRTFRSGGALALLDAGPGRGQDFAANHGMGAWAESMLEAAVNGGNSDHSLVRLGPSDGVLPTAPGYALRRRSYREIEVLEGKRPDFLLFRRVDAPAAVDEWPYRVLSPAERAQASGALLALEVKSSQFAHQRYGDTHDGRRLNFTVKEEEDAGIRRWLALFRVPLAIVQAYLDELHAVAYSEFADQRGAPDPNKQTGKPTWMVPVREMTRLAGVHGAPIGPLAPGAELESYDTLARATALTKDGKVARPLRWPAAELTGFSVEHLLTLSGVQVP